MLKYMLNVFVNDFKFENDRVACTRDADCSWEYACQRGKCVLPCSTFICGKNAICINVHHSAICSCKEGYAGINFEI